MTPPGQHIHDVAGETGSNPGGLKESWLDEQLLRADVIVSVR